MGEDFGDEDEADSETEESQDEGLVTFNESTDEPMLLGPSKKRSKEWDKRVIRDIRDAWDSQKKELGDLRSQALAAYAAGNHDLGNKICRRLEAIQRCELVESAALIERKTERRGEHASSKPFMPTSNRRVKIAKDASARDILQSLIRELESLQQAVPSQPQKLGVEAAIRLLQNGVYVPP